jgi:hypothetical protein
MTHDHASANASVIANRYLVIGLTYGLLGLKVIGAMQSLDRCLGIGNPLPPFRLRLRIAVLVSIVYITAYLDTVTKLSCLDHHTGTILS